MKNLTSKLTKYQKKVVKMIEQVVGRTPFSYEKTNGNHLKILIDGVTMPLFTGGTPSDIKSFQNFKSEVKRAFALSKEEKDDENIIVSKDKPTQDKTVQIENFVLNVAKRMRTNLTAIKKKELMLMLESGVSDELTGIRETMISSALNLALKDKKCNEYFKSADIRLMKSELKKHADFLLPNTTWYADLLKKNTERPLLHIPISLEDSDDNDQHLEKEEIEDDAIHHDLQSNKVSKSQLKKERVHSALREFVSTGRKQRISALKSLSTEESKQFIEDIQYAASLRKDEDIALIVSLMREKSLSLSDLEGKL
jgi:hypothetical protein